MVLKSKVNARNWNIWRTAYHEAGHAIAAWELGVNWVLEIHVSGAGGKVERADVAVDPETEMATTWGGPIASDLFEAAIPLHRVAPGKTTIQFMTVDEDGYEVGDATQIELLAKTCSAGASDRARARAAAIFERSEVLAGLDALAAALAAGSPGVCSLTGSEAEEIYTKAKSVAGGRREVK